MLFKEIKNDANLMERAFFVSSKVFRFCILVRVCLLFGLTKGLHNKELEMKFNNYMMLFIRCYIYSTANYMTNQLFLDIYFKNVIRDYNSLCWPLTQTSRLSPFKSKLQSIMLSPTSNPEITPPSSCINIAWGSYHSLKQTKQNYRKVWSCNEDAKNCF